MISVSNEFKQLMRTRTDFTEEAVITFTDSRTLTLTRDDFTITNNHVEDCAGANGIPLGAALQKTIQIEIANFDDRFEEYDFFGAVIQLKCKFTLSNSTETVNYGRYTVISPETYGSTIILTASDDMHKANGKFTTNLSFPVTAQTLLNDVCASCGISLASSNFRNRTFSIAKLPEQELTFRQVIGYIAMIAVGNARFNYNGYLEIKEYSFPLSSGTVQTLDMWSGNLSVSTDDIVITGIKMQKDDQELTRGAEGYCLTVENPLAAGNENAFLQLVGNVMIGASFRQFEGEHIGYPIAEFMDPVKVVDHKENEYYSFLTDIQFNFCGATSFKNSAEPPLRNSSRYTSSAARAVMQAQELIARERTAREAALAQLTELVENSNGLYSTVETQQDNSKIYYLHDKPTLAESTIVWKMTADALVMSTDGGAHWNGGMTVDGDFIARILTAEGVNADWINAGTFVIRDQHGNIIFQASADTHSVYINGQYVQIGGSPLPDQIAAGVSTANAYTDAQLETYQTSVEERFEEIEGSLDGQIETWFYAYDPTMSNVPASNWTTEALREDHSGDCFVNTSTGASYRFLKDGGTWQWKMITDTIATQALQDAARAQDTADHKRRVFYQTPTLSDEYDPGDLWVQGANGDILRCATAKVSGAPFSQSHWVKASKYTDDSSFKTFVDGDYARTIEALRGQVDGKAETWYQATDPSAEWAMGNVPWLDHNGEEILDHANENILLVYPEEAARHEGDLWHCTAAIPNTPYKANTEWIWQNGEWKPMEVPDELFDMADGKAQIFVNEPTAPYNVGDLWFASDEAGIMTCIYERPEGYTYGNKQYNPADWQERNKYTDDSSLEDFIRDTYTPVVNSLQSQLDGKVETWYQDNDPGSAWAGAQDIVEADWEDSEDGKILDSEGNPIVLLYEETRRLHWGDFWHKTTNHTEYILNEGEWEPLDIPDDVFDRIDGKAEIWGAQPVPPYHENDLWFTGKSILVCRTTRLTGDYVASDWIKRDNYTDDSAFNEWKAGAYATTLTDIQSQIDKRAETWYQGTDPSTTPSPGWNTADLKNRHKGDLWYCTANVDSTHKQGTTWRWSGTAWEKMDVPEAVFDKIDGKAQIFADEPEAPYNVGDLWFGGPQDDIKTCTYARAAGYILNNKPYNPADWVKWNKYTDDTAVTEFVETVYTPMINEVKAQLDGKVETWYQDTDPGAAWTGSQDIVEEAWEDSTEDEILDSNGQPILLRYEKTRRLHWGDFWHRTTDNMEYILSEGEWKPLDIPDEFFDMADGKAVVYTEQPTVPYNKNDMWLTGTEILVSTVTRTEGSFVRSDWVKKDFYTDDSAFRNWKREDYAEDMRLIRAQADKKAETFYSSRNPALDWTTADLKREHTGDLWYCTANIDATYKQGTTWHWSGTAWEQMDVPQAVFDEIDGKAQIFADEPEAPYSVGDLWFGGPQDDIKTCIQARAAGYSRDGKPYNPADWVKWHKYTDDSAFTSWRDTTYANTIQGFENQLDGQINTYNQTNDPAANWGTSEKPNHVGDIWYNPSTKLTKRYSHSFQWVEVHDEAAAAAMALAEKKRRIFLTTTEHPTPYGPYDIGDLWWTDTANGKGRLKMAKVARSTSGQYVSGDWIDCGYYTGTDVNNAIQTYDQGLDQQAIFNRLTNNRQNQGIFLENGNVYLNARMLGAEKVEGDQIDAKKLRVVKEVTSGGQTQEVETLYIDADGKVSINAESLKISGKNVTQSIQESNNLLEDPFGISSGLWGHSGTKAGNQSDPDGGNRAYSLTGSTSTLYSTGDNKPLKSTGNTYRFSVWLKGSTSRKVDLGINNSAITKEVDILTTWKQFTLDYEFPDDGTAASIKQVSITLKNGGSNTKLYIYNPRVEYTDPYMNQQLIMDRLTNRSNDQGIYLEGGKIYINATYLRSLLITASMIQSEDFYSVGAKIGNFVINGSGLYVNAAKGSDEFHAIDIANRNWDNGSAETGKEGYINTRSYSTALNTISGFYINGRYINSMALSDRLSLIPDAYIVNDVGLISQQQHKLGATKITGDLTVDGGLSVVGGKSAVRDTEHYGKQAYYCYETPNPMFGDIGDGTLDETGTCIVSIDDIMQEAAATQLQYYVFLQKCGEGDCWVADRQPGYFVVRGTPGLTFSWELKAKQTGYESVRYNNGSDEVRRTNFTMPGYADMYAEELAAATQGMEDTLYG